eukprot:scaffold719_cov359-Prasinococcus_capsulatus_cf.AAC.17
MPNGAVDVRTQISKRLAHGIQFDATRAVQTGRAECLQNSGLLLVQVGLKLFPFELPLEAPEEVATVVGVAVVSSLLLHPAQELLGVVFRQLPLAHEVLEVSEVHFAVTVPVEFFKQLAALRFGVVEEVSHLVQALPVHEVDLTGLSLGDDRTKVVPVRQGVEGAARADALAEGDAATIAVVVAAALALPLLLPGAREASLRLLG